MGWGGKTQTVDAAGLEGGVEWKCNLTLMNHRDGLRDSLMGSESNLNVRRAAQIQSVARPRDIHYTHARLCVYKYLYIYIVHVYCILCIYIIIYMYNVHIHIILFYVHYLENDVFFWGAINRPLIIRRKIICNALVVFSIQTRAQLEISSEGIQGSKYIFFG